jgi:hypothetical protein
VYREVRSISFKSCFHMSKSIYTRRGCFPDSWYKIHASALIFSNTSRSSGGSGAGFGTGSGSRNGCVFQGPSVRFTCLCDPKYKHELLKLHLQCQDRHTTYRNPEADLKVFQGLVFALQVLTVLVLPSLLARSMMA